MAPRSAPATRAAQRQPLADLVSPCREVCAFDQATGLCVGCRRTARELYQWFQLTPKEKHAAVDRLEAFLTERRAKRRNRKRKLSRRGRPGG